MKFFVLAVALMLCAACSAEPAATSHVALTANQVDQQLAAAAAADPEVAKREADEQAEKAEEERNGFHCLSAWDGSNRSLVELVKSDLNDPDSFEHDKTFISPVGKDGLHPIKMLFRSKNGFGGVVRGAAEGRVNPANCQATLKRVY